MRPFFERYIYSFTHLAELIFFPSYCLLCSSFLEQPKERVVCRSCWESLNFRLPSSCLCCGRFFAPEVEPHFCSQCLQNPPPFSLHLSCGEYKGKLKEIILLFKYRGYKLLGRNLAYFADQVLGNEKRLWWGTQVITPVPIHPRRKKERGFNQAQVLAKELSRYERIEFIKGLIKETHSFPQAGLSMEERSKNVKGTFSVKEGALIKGKVVVLVDDVFTTGATVKECSSVLRKAGAQEVRVITLAQTLSFL
ncbi:ComF family protein [bacterium]|nr:ComF family protein [bacterium]